MPVPKNASCYNMNHKNRGNCIIFNHDKFNSGRFDSREGSTIDVKRLKITFGNLGFDVTVHDNFTYNEIMKVIKKVSKDNDHKDNDCLCIITLTHGTRNDCLCARDVVYPSDELWKPFTADKCTSLAGKPKLFFFQACRGEDADDPVLLECREIPEETASDTIKASYTIPTYADFLIAHGSIKGYLSWRNPKKGTWYIQSLCDILDVHAEDHDLMTMLTMTAQKTATEFVTFHSNNDLHNKKQMPSVTTMLLRSVYFPPKLMNNSEKKVEK